MLFEDEDEEPLVGPALLEAGNQLLMQHGDEVGSSPQGVCHPTTGLLWSTSVCMVQASLALGATFVKLDGCICRSANCCRFLLIPCFLGATKGTESALKHK